MEADGFSYYYDGEIKSSGATRWRCTERKECSAAVHVIGDEVVAASGNHTHEIDPLTCKAAEMRQSAKDAAKTSTKRQRAISGIESDLISIVYRVADSHLATLYSVDNKHCRQVLVHLPTCVDMNHRFGKFRA